jgi:hypothetical protein
MGAPDRGDWDHQMVVSEDVVLACRGQCDYHKEQAEKRISMSYNQDWSYTHTDYCKKNADGYECLCREGKKKESSALALQTDWDDTCARAQALGCYIITPNDNQLFIDIDTPKQLQRFAERAVFSARFGFSWSITPSPSGEVGHLHIVMTLPFKVGRLSRIILQWFFGSDPKRERLSLWRWFNGSKTPTTFFEKNPTDGAFR